jgi:signal transduction histidine kinase/ligand-binding sensor domain-containing protein
MRITRTCLLLLSTLASVCGLSQSFLTNFDEFTLTNGVEFNIVDMAQDDEGFFWLATKSGLFRFDGVQAVKIHMPVPDSIAKRSENTYDLCFDPKNQLIWLGTEAGIFKYELRTGAIKHLRPDDYFDNKDTDLLGSHVVFADKQGEAWAEFGQYGLAHLPSKSKAVEIFYLSLDAKAKAAGLDENMANKILGISQDPNHENILWMNTRRGLMKFDKSARRLERFIYYPENEKMLIEANSILCHFAHPDGYIYIGTWDAGLLKFDPRSGIFTQFLLGPQPWKETVANTHRIRSIVADKTGNLWINGSGGGGALFDVKNERFTSLPVEGSDVHFQDREGNYWQFRPHLRLFHRLKNQGVWMKHPDALPCEQFTDAHFDRRNRELYFHAFCNDGAFWSLHVDKLTYQRYPLPGRAGNRVLMSSQAEGPDGFYILENLQKALYLRPAGKQDFEKIPVTFPPNAGNLSISFAPNGDLFVAGHEGWLFWLKPPDPAAGRTKWETISYAKAAVGGTLPDDFYCVSEPVFDANGRLWLRTCNGFSIFSPADGSWKHFPDQRQTILHLKNYLNFVPNGHRMWASGNSGLGWYDINRPEAGLQKMYKPEGVFRTETFNIKYFLHDKLWFHTSEGWAELDPETGNFRYFDWLKSNKMKYLHDGRLITLDGKGYHIVHLDSLRLSEETPRPYVSWFKVFEKDVPLQGSLLSPRHILLKPDENFFSIGFSALATYNTQDIRFAYKLEGVNPDWVFPDPDLGAASYTNIKGGDYTFKIKTTDYRGEWLDNTYELKIHVGTPWWKTWWARLLLLSLIASFVYWLVQNRFRQQQILLENQRLQLEKEQSLRNERDRIATEMHDDLGAGLSTIRFLSLTAKEHEPDPAKAARIDKIATQASQVMEKMADIIWVMNSRNDTMENFVAYLRRYAGELLETHGQKLIFQIPNDLNSIKLSGQLRRTMLSAVKECLHNVIKHAGATEVRLQVTVDQWLEISVEDNGNGLPDQLHTGVDLKFKSLTGNGLYNLYRRMETLGGEALIESGQGTKITLRVPLLTE